MRTQSNGEQGDWNTFTLIYLERQYFIVKEIDS
jgi:hypothetical protein